MQDVVRFPCKARVVPAETLRRRGRRYRPSAAPGHACRQRPLRERDPCVDGISPDQREASAVAAARTCGAGQDDGTSVYGVLRSTGAVAYGMPKRNEWEGVDYAKRSEAQLLERPVNEFLETAR